MAQQRGQTMAQMALSWLLKDDRFAQSRLRKNHQSCPRYRSATAKPAAMAIGFPESVPAW
jgi:hypothetical protein